MPLVIPASNANFIITLTNGSGGLSARSSVAFGFELTAPLTQAAVGTIANLMRDALTPLYDNSWLLGPVHVLENDAGLMRVWDDTGTEAGTHAVDVYAPPAISHVVTKSTGIAGRKFRGRVYLPGVPENEVSETGALGGNQVNAVTTACNNLRTTVEADAAVNRMVLFHDSTTPGPSTSTVVISMACRTVVGTMRPRQRR